MEKTGLIKKNPIYSKIWNFVWEKRKGCSFIVIGSGGSGKSWGAIKFGCDLDPNFNINRIVFTVQELMQLLKNEQLPFGSCIIFDEAVGSEESIDSRDSLSKGNKKISYLMSMIRQKRLILFYIAPMKSLLDKRVRILNNTGLMEFDRVDFKKRVSYAKFKWSVIKADSGDIYNVFTRIRNPESSKRPIVLNNLEIPQCENAELLEQYELKKTQFFDKKISDWAEGNSKPGGRETVNFNELTKTAFANLEKIKDSKGRVSSDLICLELKVPIRTAQALKKTIEKSISRS